MAQNLIKPKTLLEAKIFNSAQMLKEHKLLVSKSHTNILLDPFLVLFLSSNIGLHAFGDVLQHMCQHTDSHSYYRS